MLIIKRNSLVWNKQENSQYEQRNVEKAAHHTCWNSKTTTAKNLFWKNFKPQIISCFLAPPPVASICDLDFRDFMGIKLFYVRGFLAFLRISEVFSVAKVLIKNGFRMRCISFHSAKPTFEKLFRLSCSTISEAYLGKYIVQFRSYCYGRSLQLFLFDCKSHLIGTYWFHFPISILEAYTRYRSYVVWKLSSCGWKIKRRGKLSNFEQCILSVNKCWKLHFILKFTEINYLVWFST